MSGFIDLHTHLLPGLDDGVENLDKAVECLACAQEAGFSDIVMTRHLMSGVYESPRERADQVRRDLEKLAEKAGLAVRLHNGAEYYLDETFLPKLEKEVETLADGLYLLVEMPMMQIPHLLSDAAFHIRLKGYIPILAHVERYREISEKPARAKEIAEMGFLLQVNLGSLAGMYGRTVAKAARFILEKNLAFCLAGDTHGPRWLAPAYSDGVKVVRGLYGEKALATLLADNPKKVLGGR